jgi:RNA polymerase sigma-70 factor (ECF subfamily)
LQEQAMEVALSASQGACAEVAVQAMTAGAVAGSFGAGKADAGVLAITSIAATARRHSRQLVQEGDEHIAARFAAGDAGAFAELMRRHMGTVFGVAYGVLRDRDDAADVTQDVFLKCSQLLPRMRVQGSLGPWLYRVAMNRAIDRLRQTRRHVVINETDERSLTGALPDPGVTAERVELRGVVFRAVAKLPEKQRMVFTMRHVSGLSIEEISIATKCAPGTVKCHLARATRRLRELLAPYLQESQV